MELSEIDGLALNKIDFHDEFEPPYIDFECSEQGIWIPFRNQISYSANLKSGIRLALLLGFKWEDLGVEVHTDLKLEQWLSDLSSDNEIDAEFDNALTYLDENAYETDPGWRISFSLDGLYMESIWTDESDMWDEDRESRPIPPRISASAWREYLTLEQ